MHDEATDLDSIQLLHGLTPASRSSLARQCSWRRFNAGEEILAREDDSTDVLFIAEGKVQIVDYSPSGREVSYAEINAGGHVGELSAIDDLPRSAAVIARSNCYIATLPQAAFLRLLETEPGIALNLLKRLTRIIRQANDKVTELSTVGAMQRVYRELQRLGVEDPENGEGLIISNLPTQEVMASRLGTTRETVARVLAQLVKAKITLRRGRTLYVRDAEQLDALANPEAEGW